MRGLSGAATFVAVVVWVVLAFFNGMWTAFYGQDLASAILVVLALVIGVVAAYCLGRAVDARRERTGLLWAGRALALAGAAAAVAFPTVLYGEIAMLAQQREAPTYDIEAAIWHSFWTLPLTLVPALVALRWGRIGGILFVLLAAYAFLDSLYHFGGVNYFPEARTDLVTLVMANAPAFVTGVLLFVGASRWSGEPSVTLLRRPSPA